jgi:hypothetical protein
MNYQRLIIGRALWQRTQIKRNPIANHLSSPLYRQRIVRNGKLGAKPACQVLRGPLQPDRRPLTYSLPWPPDPGWHRDKGGVRWRAPVLASNGVPVSRLMTSSIAMHCARR